MLVCGAAKVHNPLTASYCWEQFDLKLWVQPNLRFQHALISRAKCETPDPIASQFGSPYCLLTNNQPLTGTVMPTVITLCLIALSHRDGFALFARNSSWTPELIHKLVIKIVYVKLDG